jgi:phosphinothricin acetyltransferase
MSPDACAARVVLREATDADTAAVQAVYAHYVRHSLATFEEEPPDAAEMARRRADIVGRGLPYLVAELDGMVKGFAYAGPYRLRSAYRFTLEDSIYVAPEALGRGLGRRLLFEIIGRSTALGYRQMVAVIGDSANAASIGLHGHLGFQPVGILRAAGFKFGRWVDSVLMQRPLGPGDATPP